MRPPLGGVRSTAHMLAPFFIHRIGIDTKPTRNVQLDQFGCTHEWACPRSAFHTPLDAIRYQHQADLHQIGQCNWCHGDEGQHSYYLEAGMLAHCARFLVEALRFHSGHDATSAAARSTAATTCSNVIT